MPFSIEMRSAERSLEVNAVLKAELLREFPSISEFPLDHDLITREVVHVPRQDVLKHWPQFELHASAELCEAIVTIWLADAYIELSSRPETGCGDVSRRIEPLLAFFRCRGFEILKRAELLAEYEAQRKRVETVERMMRADTGGS